MAKRVLIVSERFGSGDDELGSLLMRNFLYSLAREESRPDVIMLANSGVKLACEGSASIDDLRLLAENGVAVKACGTCLDYFGLTESLQVGEIGTMPGSVTALMGGDAVVTIG